MYVYTNQHTESVFCVIIFDILYLYRYTGFIEILDFQIVYEDECMAVSVVKMRLSEKDYHGSDTKQLCHSFEGLIRQMPLPYLFKVL